MARPRLASRCSSLLTTRAVPGPLVARSAAAVLRPVGPAPDRPWLLARRAVHTNRDFRTEYEHKSDDAINLLPQPRNGGFARGSFITWRRDNEDHTESLESFYEITNKVGEGGFAEVHAARHLRTGEMVAVKKIDQEKVTEPEALKAEVSFLSLADHPNVIRYYETLEDDHHHYLIMEMCSGGVLSEYIKGWHENHGLGIAEKDLARIVIQMVRALAYCHAHGIAHRDVKPQNFIFGCGSPQGSDPLPIACSGHSDAPLKLLDFGISGVVRGGNSKKKRRLTRRAGTDGYMAPEVLDGQPYGRKADIFSMGACMATIISGKAPVWVADKGVYKFPGRVRWARMSQEARDFMERCLDPDQEKRPSASEAAQDPWFKSMGAVLPFDSAEGFRDCVLAIENFAQRSKLQRCIMSSIVAFAPLHNQMMEKLRILFIRADTDNNGGITPENFRGIFKNPRVDPETLFKVVNASQSGLISYSEWLAAAAPQEWYNISSNSRRAFDVLDHDHNGYITHNELAHLFPKDIDVLSIKNEIRSLFPHRDGKLTFEDFCAVSGQIYTDACI